MTQSNPDLPSAENAASQLPRHGYFAVRLGAPGVSSALRTEIRASAAPGAAFYEWPVTRSELWRGATGPVTLIVTHDGQSAAPVLATLESSAPGLFTFLSGSNLFAAAVHMNGIVVGDPSMIASTSPAVPGETIEIFGTGFAPSPAGTENIVVSSLSPVPVVTIGGTQTMVTFGGLSGPGLYQLNVVVPNLAPGTYPVQVSWNGVTSGSTPQLFVGSS